MRQHRLLPGFVERKWRNYIAPTLAVLALSLVLSAQLALPHFFAGALATSTSRTAGTPVLHATDSGKTAAQVQQIAQASPNVQGTYVDESTTANVTSGAHIFATLLSTLPPRERLTAKIVGGAFPNRDTQALVSRSLAQSLNLGIGDSLHLIPDDGAQTTSTLTLQVAGIFVRSPFSSEPGRLEVLASAASDFRAATTNLNTMVGDDQVIVVPAAGVLPSALSAELKRAGIEDVRTATQYYSDLHSEQELTANYLQTSVQLLLGLPLALTIVLCGLLFSHVSRLHATEYNQLRLLGASRRYVFFLPLIGSSICAIVGALSGAVVFRILEQLGIYLLARTSTGSFIVPSNAYSEIAVHGLGAPLTAVALTTFIALISALPAAIHTATARPRYLTGLAADDTALRRPQENYLMLVATLITIVFSAVVSYYCVIIPENMLYVADISSDVQNLKLVGFITFALFAGLVCFQILQRVLARLLTATPRRRALGRVPLHSIGYMQTPAAHLATSAIISATAAIFALATVTVTTNEAYAAYDREYLPYDFSVEELSSAQLRALPQTVVDELRSNEDVAASVQVSVVNGEILSQQGDELGIHYVHAFEPGQSTRYLQRYHAVTSGSVKLRDTELSVPSGSIALPEDMFEGNDVAVPTHVDLVVDPSSIKGDPSTSSSGTMRLELSVIITDLPWPVISTNDFTTLLGQHGHNQLWLTLTPDARQDFFSAYKELSQVVGSYNSAASNDANRSALQILSTAETTTSEIHNHVSTRVTLAVLTVTLLGALVSTTSLMLRAARELQPQMRLLEFLGTPNNQLNRGPVAWISIRNVLAAVLGVAIGTMCGLRICTYFLNIQLRTALDALDYRPVLWLLATGAGVAIASALIGALWWKLSNHRHNPYT